MKFTELSPCSWGPPALTKGVWAGVTRPPAFPWPLRSVWFCSSVLSCTGSWSPGGRWGAGAGKQDPLPHSLTLFTSRKNVRAFFPFPGYESQLNNAPGSRHCLPGLHSPPTPPRPRTLASSPDDVNLVSPSAHPPHPLEPTAGGSGGGGARVAMATAHNRKQGPSGGLSWGRNTGSRAEHRAALSVAVKSKTGQKDLMRTISPKKKEKKKRAEKTNKAKQPEGRRLAELQGPRVSPPDTMSVK